MTYPFPPSFIADKAHLKDIFINEAISLGISHIDATRLFKQLPASVQSATAVKFSLGPEDWRYIFGKPFHIGASHGFGVPHQAPLVVNLVRAIAIAERALTPTQYRSWWWQTNIPSKHLDAIVEMLAVSSVPSEYNLSYEQKGLGVGSHQIDWLLKTKEDGDFLLEVKNRPGQSAQELIRIRSTSSNKASSVRLVVSGEPITDFDALFKSTFSKFLPTHSSSCIQGVILFLGIKVPADRFAKFFHEHLQANLHFVALGKEDKTSGISTNILATSPEISRRVCSAFGWNESADLIY